MTIPNIFGLYGILTDPVVGYEKLAEAMVEKGISIIQLRMKDCALDEVEKTARLLRGVIPSTSKFIVNDDPMLAARVGADGVHLGQSDMAFAEARRIVGPDSIIGLSTHNTIQTRNACKLGPDYIGVGPVFPTPTKKMPDPVIGLDGMKKMLDEANVPAVVLGGIDHSNISHVVRSGAHNICAVRCINQSKDPGREIDKLLDAILASSEM